MATESREDRRLMRQRGAGVRELKTTTIGFTFGSGTNSLTASPTPGSAVHSRSAPQTNKDTASKTQGAAAPPKAAPRKSTAAKRRRSSPVHEKEKEALPMPADKATTKEAHISEEETQVRPIGKAIQAVKKGVRKLLHVDEKPVDQQARDAERPAKRPRRAAARPTAGTYTEPNPDSPIRERRPSSEASRKPTNKKTQNGAAAKLASTAGTSGTGRKRQRAVSDESPEPSKPAAPISQTTTLNVPLDSKKPRTKGKEPNLSAEVPAKTPRKRGRPRKVDTSGASHTGSVTKEPTEDSGVQNTLPNVKQQGKAVARKDAHAPKTHTKQPAPPGKTTRQHGKQSSPQTTSPKPAISISDSDSNTQDSRNASQQQSAQKVASSRLAGILRDSDDELLQSSDDEPAAPQPAARQRKSNVESQGTKTSSTKPPARTSARAQAQKRASQPTPASSESESEPFTDDEDLHPQTKLSKKSAATGSARKQIELSAKKNTLSAAKPRNPPSPPPSHKDKDRSPLFRRPVDTRRASPPQAKARSRRRRVPIPSDLFRNENDGSELEQNSFLDHFPEPKIPDSLVARSEGRLNFRM